MTRPPGAHSRLPAFRASARKGLCQGEARSRPWQSPFDTLRPAEPCMPSRPRPSFVSHLLPGSLALCGLAIACAVQGEERRSLEPMVVTGSYNPSDTFDLPFSVDSIERRQIADGQPRHQPLRSPAAGTWPGGAEPPELRPGPANLLARLRRPLGLRYPRAEAARRRHPGQYAGWPGPGRDPQPRRRRAHRGTARAGLDDLRQQRRRGDPDVLPRRPGRPAGRRGNLRRQRWPEPQSPVHGRRGRRGRFPGGCLADGHRRLP